MTDHNSFPSGDGAQGDGHVDEHDDIGGEDCGHVPGALSGQLVLDRPLRVEGHFHVLCVFCLLFPLLQIQSV